MECNDKWKLSCRSYTGSNNKNYWLRFIKEKTDECISWVLTKGQVFANLKARKIHLKIRF
jgi:hypothetical protein